MQRLCVFWGSSSGRDPAYASAAAHLGRVLAGRGTGLVYGGGRVGLMGVLADAALAAGGAVIGVSPPALLERKALMGELAGGFIALPGGVGTLEELFEVWSWATLGLHRKPCGLLDVNGFFVPLVSFLDRQVEAGFIHPAYRAMLTLASTPEALLEAVAAYEPPAEKWTPPLRRA